MFEASPLSADPSSRSCPLADVSSSLRFRFPPRRNLLGPGFVADASGPARFCVSARARKYGTREILRLGRVSIVSLQWVRPDSNNGMLRLENGRARWRVVGGESLGSRDSRFVIRVAASRVNHAPGSGSVVRTGRSRRAGWCEGVAKGLSSASGAREWGCPAGRCVLHRICVRVA